MGIKTLHDHNIVHRNIKSSNILFNSDGEIKLGDLATAAYLTAKNNRRKTHITHLAYTAPEQVTGDCIYGSSADIWSFGIFCHEIANSKPQALDNRKSRKLFDIQFEEMSPIDGKWSNNFRNFVTCCLIRDPESRWSANQLLQHEFMHDAENYQKTFGGLVGTMFKLH
jgi:serine/threonine-protein kinase 24/25/MST4